MLLGGLPGREAVVDQRLPGEPGQGQPGHGRLPAGHGRLARLGGGPGLDPGGQRVAHARDQEPVRRVGAQLGVDQDQVGVVGEEHVLLEHAVVGVDHRQGAGRASVEATVGTVAQAMPAWWPAALAVSSVVPPTDPDHHVGLGLPGGLGDPVDLPVGADAAEGLAGEVDPRLLERRRELVAGQLPHVLVRDQQRLLAELGHVPADGSEHRRGLDVAAGAMSDWTVPASAMAVSPLEAWRSGHLRVAG